MKESIIIVLILLLIFGHNGIQKEHKLNETEIRKFNITFIDYDPCEIILTANNNYEKEIIENYIETKLHNGCVFNWIENENF